MIDVLRWHLQIFILRLAVSQNFAAHFQGSSSGSEEMPLTSRVFNLPSLPVGDKSLADLASDSKPETGRGTLLYYEQCLMPSRGC